jgi:hypothetical protein
MYYLVCVDHNGLTAHISLDVKGFKYCVSCVIDETYNDMLWNGCAEGGCVGFRCEEDEGKVCEIISIVGPTRCTFLYSVYYELTDSTCFKQYLLTSGSAA